MTTVETLLGRGYDGAGTRMVFGKNAVVRFTSLVLTEEVDVALWLLAWGRGTIHFFLCSVLFGRCPETSWLLARILPADYNLGRSPCDNRRVIDDRTSADRKLRNRRT